VGIELGLNPTSSTRSNLPACWSASWVAASVTPMVTVILFTYWCLTGSALCVQVGFFTMVIDRFGMYELIAYGPSETVCLSYATLPGRYLSASAGRADANGMASMNGKSPAGLIRWNWIVDEFGVVMPEMVCVFWNCANCAAVGLLIFAKWLVSAVQYCA